MDQLARTPKEIGAAIRRARKLHGWSQSELGHRAGLRQATISLIETGDRPAKLDSILAVLAALDLEFTIGARSKSAPSDVEALS
ncbi:helix-turn-helix domain-containing protein [Limimaricola sp. G21655-S1]|uniref:helix-turn-helix domain-containing protein n=1 Tax=Limimaricola sp. G21655-S1 TaxID=3014768 RepID=UPI0022AFCAEE|nr:helix-turn-helix domain-containing protein [Limimaricola sp. G21655-S1]MCZ4260870.1 helix-turn-helix domain-containing protein [Limimaricola sp. G21655-S1]